MRERISMDKQQVFHRPPAEADSFIIKVMEGCPHNKCTFCGSFRGIQSRPLPLDEVLSGIENDARGLGPRLVPLVTGLYLEGGDPIALPAPRLTRIISHAKRFFPGIRHIACYSTVAQIKKKNAEELAVLAAVGLKRVYVGVESGCNEILRAVQKGCTAEDMVLAADKLRAAGIENDVSIIIGLGGPELSERHAVDTGEVLNATRPYCVRVRTYVPYFNTSMGEDYMAGRFRLLDAHEALREMRLLVRTIREKTFLLGEHWSNFMTFGVQMPEGKEKLIEKIDELLQRPLDFFRPTGITECHATATERVFYSVSPTSKTVIQ